MKKRNVVILTVALALAPGALLLAVWGGLPDTVVTTWGLNGAVTGTGSKLALVWPVGLELLLCAFLLAAPYLDPKRENYPKFSRRYHSLCIVMMLFFSGINCVDIWENFRPGSFAVSRVVTGMLGLVFLCTGNVMPTFRHNYFVGIRTPWTLADPAVWEKANRLGGRLFFLCGLGMLAMTLLLPESWLAAGSLLLALTAALLPCVMSFVWWRKKASNPGDAAKDRPDSL